MLSAPNAATRRHPENAAVSRRLKSAAARSSAILPSAVRRCASRVFWYRMRALASICKPSRATRSCSALSASALVGPASGVSGACNNGRESESSGQSVRKVRRSCCCHEVQDSKLRFQTGRRDTAYHADVPTRDGRLHHDVAGRRAAGRQREVRRRFRRPASDPRHAGRLRWSTGGRRPLCWQRPGRLWRRLRLRCCGPSWGLLAREVQQRGAGVKLCIQRLAERNCQAPRPPARPHPTGRDVPEQRQRARGKACPRRDARLPVAPDPERPPAVRRAAEARPQRAAHSRLRSRDTRPGRESGPADSGSSHAIEGGRLSPSVERRLRHSTRTHSAPGGAKSCRDRAGRYRIGLPLAQADIPGVRAVGADRSLL